MNETAHTPGSPKQLWAIEYDGFYRWSCSILDHNGEMDSQRYVRADIADDMLAALKDCAQILTTLAVFQPDPDVRREMLEQRDFARAAISKATQPEGTRT